MLFYATGFLSEMCQAPRMAVSITSIDFNGGSCNYEHATLHSLLLDVAITAASAYKTRVKEPPHMRHSSWHTKILPL